MHAYIYIYIHIHIHIYTYIYTNYTHTHTHTHTHTQEGLEGEEMFAPLVPPESEAAPTKPQQVKGAKKKTAAE